MADTTTRTPWAASVEDRSAHSADTRDEAISLALADLAEDIDSGESEPGRYPLRVYADVVWCAGPDDYTDCPCGANHDDIDEPCMVSWAARTRHTVVATYDGHEARCWVDGEAPRG